jgi:hypothetical protein
MMMTHFIVGGGLNCTFCLDNPNKRLTLCGLCLSPSGKMERTKLFLPWKEQNCSFASIKKYRRTGDTTIQNQNQKKN